MGCWYMLEARVIVFELDEHSSDISGIPAVQKDQLFMYSSQPNIVHLFPREEICPQQERDQVSIG